jgi:hypothetical protein
MQNSYNSDIVGVLDCCVAIGFGDFGSKVLKKLFLAFSQEDAI